MNFREQKRSVHNRKEVLTLPMVVEEVTPELGLKTDIGDQQWRNSEGMPYRENGRNRNTGGRMKAEHFSIARVRTTYRGKEKE